jgi:hypothetical protein
VSRRAPFRGAVVALRAAFALVASSLLAACAETKPVTPVIDVIPRGVAFEQSVPELKRARPNVRYVPYGGWHEELPVEGAFESVSYRFTGATPGEHETSEGRLWAVTMMSDSAQSTDSLVRLLDQKLGRHEFAGCAFLPTPHGRQEVAYLVWSGTPQLVATSIAVDTNSHVGPPTLYVAKVGSKVEQLSAIPLRAECRSRGLVLALGKLEGRE